MESSAGRRATRDARASTSVCRARHGRFRGLHFGVGRCQAPARTSPLPDPGSVSARDRRRARTLPRLRLTSMRINSVSRGRINNDHSTPDSQGPRINVNQTRGWRGPPFSSRQKIAPRCLSRSRSHQAIGRDRAIGADMTGITCAFT